MSSEYPDAIYVAGCQRAGTTMMSRILSSSQGMMTYQYTSDDELDAALILAGFVTGPKGGRVCFQTTYLNEHFVKYQQLSAQSQLIWVIRNPQSVVYSMVYSWRRFALNELFEACGLNHLDQREHRRYENIGRLAISPIVRACCAYDGKNLQLPQILKMLGTKRTMVVEYDDIVSQPHKVLPLVYRFVGLEFDPDYASKIHKESLKKQHRLSTNQQRIINDRCVPVYQRMLKYLSYDRTKDGLVSD